MKQDTHVFRKKSLFWCRTFPKCWVWVHKLMLLTRDSPCMPPPHPTIATQQGKWRRPGGKVLQAQTDRMQELVSLGHSISIILFWVLQNWLAQYCRGGGGEKKSNLTISSHALFPPPQAFISPIGRNFLNKGNREGVDTSLGTNQVQSPHSCLFENKIKDRLRTNQGSLHDTSFCTLD